MKFIKTIKDNNNIYFLVEYIKGMELFDVIRDIGLLNTYDS
jgi:cGMP-dependent protein kinase